MNKGKSLVQRVANLQLKRQKLKIKGENQKSKQAIAPWGVNKFLVMFTLSFLP